MAPESVRPAVVRVTAVRSVVWPATAVRLAPAVAIVRLAKVVTTAKLGSQLLSRGTSTLGESRCQELQYLRAVALFAACSVLRSRVEVRPLPVYLGINFSFFPIFYLTI